MMADNVNPTQQSVLNKASKDKFLLVLDIPLVLRGSAPNVPAIQNINPIQYTIFGTVVPDIRVPTIPIPFGGQTLNVTSYTRPNYDPFTVNFVVDNSFVNYSILWAWLNVLNTANGSIYGGNLATLPNSTIPEYASSFSVYALNEYDQQVAQWTYSNAIITGLGRIDYNYRDIAWVESTATFQFSKVDFNLIDPPLT